MPMMSRRATGLVLAAVMAAGAAGGPVAAESRSDLFKSRVQLLDKRSSEQYRSSVRLQPPRAEVPSKLSTKSYEGSYSGPLLALARSAARRHGVPEDLFLRLVQQESGWKVNARSHKGALGLAQLMPQTARLLGVNPADPAQNLEGGARYLRQQFEEFGSWRLALAAYNAGPGAVRKHGGVPPYRETRNYVRIIWGS